MATLRSNEIPPELWNEILHFLTQDQAREYSNGNGRFSQLVSRNLLARERIKKFKMNNLPFGSVVDKILESPMKDDAMSRLFPISQAAASARNDDIRQAIAHSHSEALRLSHDYGMRGTDITLLLRRKSNIPPTEWITSLKAMASSHTQYNKARHKRAKMIEALIGSRKLNYDEWLTYARDALQREDAAAKELGSFKAHIDPSNLHDYLEDAVRLGDIIVSCFARSGRHKEILLGKLGHLIAESGVYSFKILLVP